MQLVAYIGVETWCRNGILTQLNNAYGVLYIDLRFEIKVLSCEHALDGYLKIYNRLENIYFHDDQEISMP